MQVPISWLKEYVDLNLPVKELADRITLAGLEVEAIERTGDWWDPDTILVGQILAVQPHPDADRLVLVDVDYGADKPEQVVTGAPNLFQYKGVENLPVLKVAFARAGAVLIDAYSEARPRPKKKLKPSKIRGIPSNGMVCSERELGLSEEHEGILLLPEDGPVGMSLRDYLGDEVLVLGLTVDMARCLSVIGVAREVAALTEAKLHLPPDDTSLAEGQDVEKYMAVLIEDPDLCHRYTGMLIQDVQIGNSPAWMQERLTKAGMRPINNVVDISNYVMLEWGQPLHAFDYDLLVERAKKSGAEKPAIIVRRAHAGEKLTTLDGVERELDETMLLITDTLGPIAIAGVMGSLETEVHDGTRNVLLESATFDTISNRHTAQKLRLPSEAAHRFTRGVPTTLNPIGGRRAAQLMRNHANGKIVLGIVDVYPVPQQVRVVSTTESNVSRLLGRDIPLHEIAASLERLDFVCERLGNRPVLHQELGGGAFGLHIEADEPILRCTVPWYRLDVQYPADLAEEVARVIGYEKIPLTLMDDVLPPQRRNLALETEEKIRDILVGCGLQETISYSLTTTENHDRVMRAPLGSGEHKVPWIKLLNPLSTKRQVMRRDMLVSALENLVYNYRYTQRYPVFEIGRVYLPETGDGVRPDEDPRLCILLTGPRRLSSLHPDPAGAENFDFFDLKGMIETLLQRLGFSDKDVEFIHERNPAYTATSARMNLQGSSLGIIGEVDPQVLLNFELPTGMQVYAAQMHIKPLIRPSWQVQPIAAISNYPPVVEDLAFVVSDEIPSTQLLDAIRKGGGNLVTKVELFDIYRGQQLPEGHKSLAYKVTYEGIDAPLKDSQVVSARNRIIRRVGEAVGGTLRV